MRFPQLSNATIYVQAAFGSADFCSTAAPASRRVARLRRKDPNWLVVALIVFGIDLLLAAIGWIIVDLALT